MFLLAWLCTAVAMAQGGYVIDRDISYVTPGETDAYRMERCKLDVYRPANGKGLKTIVWYHGGSMVKGSKKVPQQLRDKGFIVVVPNYRLSPRAKAPAYIDDAAEAVAWTVRNIHRYGGSGDSVWVGGHSAGAYLVLMLALDKQYLGRYGVDADSLRGYYPASGQTATHYAIRTERGLDRKCALVDSLAPLNRVRKLGAPLTLFTGDRRLEMTSRYEENLYLQALLRAAGNDVPLHEMQGFNHSGMAAPALLWICNDLNNR